VNGIVSRSTACITDHLVRGRHAWRSETASSGQFHRHYGIRRNNPDSLNVQASCAMPTDALLSILWAARLPILFLALADGQFLMQRAEVKAGY
jgi:hypothetical protein